MVSVETLIGQLIETWTIHNRINLYLLDAIPPEALGDVSASKGRSVAAEFAHIHNVRLMWLKSAVPELLTGLDKVEAKPPPAKDQLHAALTQSGPAVESMLRAGMIAGKIKGFKPHPIAFLGYLISHESYHRAEIGIILTQSGHPLDHKTAYGQWEWGVR
jgi:uncharacterized damage-inducible protein DinB